MFQILHPIHFMPGVICVCGSSFFRLIIPSAADVGFLLPNERPVLLVTYLICVVLYDDWR